MIHNDDTTTMEFVESVLQRHLQIAPATARRLMLTVHQRGHAALGRMTAEEARLIAEAITERARLAGFPLMLTYRRSSPLTATY